MSPGVTPAASERVSERRPAVALASHYREAEGLSIAQIAERLGHSPATIKAYFYDPTGEQARAVKARYRGVCRGCGAYTQPRNKGDAYALCKGCHPRRDPGSLDPRPGAGRDARVARAVGAVRAVPSSHDWSRTHANRRVGDALERLAEGEWPAATVVTSLFGTWAAARAAAGAMPWRRRRLVPLVRCLTALMRSVCRNRTRDRRSRTWS